TSGTGFRRRPPPMARWRAPSPSRARPSSAGGSGTAATTPPTPTISSAITTRRRSSTASRSRASTSSATSSRQIPERRPHRLPDLADLLRGLGHRRSRLAGEGLSELWHVHDQPVRPVLRGWMRVGPRPEAPGLRTDVAAGPLRVPTEEPLVGREPVHGRAPL